MSNTNTEEQKAVAALIERWAVAARISDLNTIMSLYTPDIVAFDALSSLQFKGKDAYRKHWETCIEYMPGGEMIMEVHELDVTVSGDVAFAHYVTLCGGKDEHGKEQTDWMRATVCCKKTPAGWLISHEHYSMPFDPESMKAMSGLTP